MNDNTIVIILGFVVTLISVMTPIIKLNSSITKLNVTMDNVNNSITENKKTTKEQGEQLQDHEIRIDRLEHK